MQVLLDFILNFPHAEICISTCFLTEPRLLDEIRLYMSPPDSMGKSHRGHTQGTHEPGLGSAKVKRGRPWLREIKSVGSGARLPNLNLPLTDGETQASITFLSLSVPICKMEIKFLGILV